MKAHEEVTFDQLTSDDPKLWRRFERELDAFGDQAMRQHLAEGRPVYFADKTHGGRNVRLWPDGRKEFVDLDENFEIVVLGQAG